MTKSLLDRRMLIVTGKGGVGKSTVAAALGWIAAAQGKKVLLCEFEPKGDLAFALEGVGARNQEPLRFSPREVHPGLWAMAMDPEESLKEYLRLNLRIPFVTRIGALSGVFDFLANAAPGVREIVTIGKVAYEARRKAYDLIVVDATATGHVLGQLRAPQAINELVGVGLIRSQTSWMLDILGDPDITGLVVTSTLEEMPVTESLELLHDVDTKTNVNTACIVANRILPAPFTVAGEKVFQSMRADASRLGLNDTRLAARIVSSFPVWSTASGTSRWLSCRNCLMWPRDCP
jgi:anion-transporting  ArsA/GET3 family ATPase